MAFPRIRGKTLSACLALLTAAGLAVGGYRYWKDLHDPKHIAAEFADFARQSPRITQQSSANVAAHTLTRVVNGHHRELQTLLGSAPDCGLAESMEEIRRIHEKHPERPLLPHGLARASATTIQSVADRNLTTGWIAGKRPPFSLQTPIDWAADPHGDTSWRMWLNAWQPLEPLLLAYEQTGNPRYLQSATTIALDWIEQHVFDERENPLAWYDMAIGRRAAVLGKLLDANLRRGFLDDGRIVDLFIAARLHGLKLTIPSKITWGSNHGIYQLVGLLALAKAVPELNGADEFHEFATSGLRRLLQEHFTTEAIHREHSPFYHVALVNTLGLLAEQGLLADDASRDLFERASRNIVWLCHPHGDLVRAGDSDLTPVNKRILYPDPPELRYLLSEGADGAPPQTAFRIFRKSGYAVFRSPWDYRPWPEASYLFFSAAFHSGMHKHADDMTFEWSERGRQLLIDAGRYAYKYEHPHRRYVESTRAHNTVEIDGRNFSRHGDDVFGSAIVAGGETDGAYFVEALIDRHRDFETRHRRVLVFLPGQWLVVIDRLTSPRSHQFTQCFHFAPDLEFATASSGGAVATIPGSGDALHVRPLSPAGHVGTHIIRGQTQPRLQGWTSLAAYELIPNDAIEIRTRGSEVTYATLLALGPREKHITPGRTDYDPRRGEFRVRWQCDGAQVGFDYRHTPPDGELRLRLTRQFAGDVGGAVER